MSAEQNELNLLLQNGVKLTLRYREKEPLTWRFWRKRKIINKTIQLTFKEPTLAVLDRVRLELLEIDFNEKRLNNKNADVVLEEGKRIAYGSCRNMARLIAIFALGESLWKFSDNTFVEDSEELERLTAIILQSVQPSVMEQLITCLTSLSNIGSFINSIRLISAVGTTTAQNRIE